MAVPGCSSHQTLMGVVSLKGITVHRCGYCSGILLISNLSAEATLGRGKWNKCTASTPVVEEFSASPVPVAKRPPCCWRSKLDPNADASVRRCWQRVADYQNNVVARTRLGLSAWLGTTYNGGISRPLIGNNGRLVGGSPRSYPPVGMILHRIFAVFSRSASHLCHLFSAS
jgi:hypothetical protein